MKSFLSRLKTLNALNIERTYKQCDDAVTKLRAEADASGRGENAELNALVEQAIASAQHVLSFKGQKPWDGAYREMHEYLAKIYMEQQRYEESREQARSVHEYDKHEGEYLVKQIDAHEAGQKIGDFDPSKAEESTEAH